jgi:hypothetical protein
LGTARNSEQRKKDAVELMCNPKNVRAVDFVAKALEENKTLPGEVTELLVDLSDGEITKAELDECIGWQYPSLSMTFLAIPQEVVRPK